VCATLPDPDPISEVQEGEADAEEDEGEIFFTNTEVIV
jgi:hypothetical protein